MGSGSHGGNDIQGGGNAWLRAPATTGSPRVSVAETTYSAPSNRMVEQPRVYLFTISKNKLDRLVARRNCSVNKFFILFCTLRQQKTSNASVYLVLVCEKKLTAR